MKDQQAEAQPDSRLTVLIVDDSKVIRLALNKILKKDFEVIQASDGAEALICLDENQAISAIFSDVSMPNLDGFGLLDKVRTSADDRIAKLPFIIITAKDDDADFIAKVKNAGGDDLITKPFKTNEITACINKYIVIGKAEAAEEMPEAQVTAEVDTPIENEAGLADNIDIDVSAIMGLDLNDEMAIDKVTTESVQENILDNGVEFIVEEDFFNETAESVSTDTEALEVTGNSSTASKPVDEFFVNIDESMLLPDIEDGMVDKSAPSQSDTEDSIDDNPLAANNIDWSIEEPHTTDMTDISDELSLDIEFDVDDNHAAIDEPEESIIEASPNKKMELEQARKRAMDIAREHVEIEEEQTYETAAEKARRAAERNRIREELQKLRDREVVEKTYQKGLDYPAASKMTSFFSGLVRIISGIFGFRKK